MSTSKAETSSTKDVSEHKAGDATAGGDRKAPRPLASNIVGHSNTPTPTQTKECVKCHVVKDVNCFGVSNFFPDKKNTRCKECVRKYLSDYYEKNKDRIKVVHKRSRIKNIKRFKETQKLWRLSNSEKIKKWRTDNKDKVYATNKKSRKKLHSTGSGKVHHRMTVAIYRALKSNKAGSSWESLVGYTVNDLKRHIESRFKPGMSWENMEEWHIDHIIPRRAFNYSSPEHPDFKRCWALKNLQPLWARDNCVKNGKLSKPFQPSLRLEEPRKRDVQPSQQDYNAMVLGFR